MRIKIIKPGLLSTIQDRGRHLFLSNAVPLSGYMDSLSARLSNIVIGNDDSCAVVEFTYGNASFVTESSCIISYAGSGSELICNDQVLPSNRPLKVPPGKLLSIVQKSEGCRLYLAIKGGFNVEEVLGSRSTFLTAGFGGFEGRKLNVGDELRSFIEVENLSAKEIKYPEWSVNMDSLLPKNKHGIRVVRGPEVSWFTEESVATFFSESFSLSMRSNRMGIHLEGTPIERKIKKELLSTAVTLGTIQVTGEGKLILLMMDCQTTGGYPRIGNVASVDLALCGQLRAGEKIFFKEISYEESIELFLNRENQLLELRNNVKDKLDSFYGKH